MKMRNLRWSKDEHSFPKILGNGQADWWVTYANVHLMIDRSIFKHFNGIFFWFTQFNRSIQAPAGDIYYPYESRTKDGDYIPWGHNDFGPGGQMTMIQEHFDEESD